MGIITKKKVELPRIDLQAALIDKIGQLVSAGIVQNIQRQQQTTGAKIKTNALATRAKKMKAGRPPISLVDEKRRFIQKTSWPFTKTKISSGWLLVFKPGNAELAELNRSVQKMGYTGWLGASAKTISLVRSLIRKTITDLFRKKR